MDVIVGGFSAPKSLTSDKLTKKYDEIFELFLNLRDNLNTKEAITKETISTYFDCIHSQNSNSRNSFLLNYYINLAI